MRVLAVVRWLLGQRTVRQRLTLELLLRKRVSSVEAGGHSGRVCVGRLLVLSHVCVACCDLVVRVLLLLVLRSVVAPLRRRRLLLVLARRLLVLGRGLLMLVVRLLVLLVLGLWNRLRVLSLAVFNRLVSLGLVVVLALTAVGVPRALVAFLNPLVLLWHRLHRHLPVVIVAQIRGACGGVGRLGHRGSDGVCEARLGHC